MSANVPARFVEPVRWKEGEAAEKCEQFTVDHLIETLTSCSTLGLRGYNKLPEILGVSETWSF